MSFDQTNNRSPHHQAQPEQQDVALPPLSSEYQRYRPGSLPYPNTNYRSSSPDYANRHDNYAYPSSSWKQQQSAHPYPPPSLPPQHHHHHQQQQQQQQQYPPLPLPPTSQVVREYGYPPQAEHSNSAPYDPIRSNYSESHEAPVQMPAPIPAPVQAPVQQNRSSTAISPIMSISQLLSSENNNNNNTNEEEEAPIYSPRQPLFEPAHRNGIQSLLNNDVEDEEEEEKYNMADSDTDTEDIPLIKSPKVTVSSPPPQSQPTAAVEPLITEIVENGNSHEHHYQHHHQLHHRDSDDSDSDGSELIVARKTKSFAERIREELDLSDENDDDDDEVLATHREEMIQFMIHVHQRKKRAIEKYQKSQERKNAPIRDRIERLYEKRYGTSMPRKSIGKKRQRALSDVGDSTDSEEHAGLHTSMSTYSSGNVVQNRKQAAAQKVEDERRRVWLNIARKDIPRMTRILSRVQATRSGNCKKVAQYCQKEVRRAITNGGRANREQQNKAKRAMKEMLLFWKKNEKEERELRKKAEKEALDRLKQEEERREAQRQARKLNFLITQTELYSHFIGRKIKQDTGEDDETAAPAPSGLSTPLAPVTESDELDASAGVQHLGEVDFDEEDEAVLKEKARLSAQNALAKQREQTRQFDEGARERRIAAGDNPDANLNQLALDDMNFQEPSSMGSGPEVQQPNMLMCQLKSYQLKGLNWLANLYEQGINGILADEMGLGKTVQSISLLAYLAEVHNIWGPFLVIAPASTLHNWQQEFTKFVPQFRALPYWGNPKERKILRQFWNRKQLYGKDAPFHIVITSYQLVLTDVSYFQRVKWQYMVLDEAQAIKSSSSARWKQLLGFHCRNRLLLTGTPIQNSMQELWALLHFIMPTLFDSHEEFSEWFSKDIESHAENRGSLNEHQLRRLHMILKPFMLRRIKRNVQHELGEKIEVEIYCDLTARQKAFYRGLKEKISISELLEKATSLSDLENMDSLMNLVMQFRKVCNHPELFERADVESPLSFCEFSQSGSLSKETLLYCPYSSRNPIKFQIPKKLYRNGGILKQVGPHSRRGFELRYVNNELNIWNDQYIHENSGSSFSFLQFCQTSSHEASYLFKANLVHRWIAALAKRAQHALLNYTQSETWALPDRPTSPFAITHGSAMEELTNLSDNMVYDAHLYGQCYLPPANAVPIEMICDDVSFIREQQEVMFNKDIRSCFFGTPQYISRTEPEEASNLGVVVRNSAQDGIMTVPANGYGFSWMRVPSMKDLILDSGKLAALDKLLERLKTEGHRCLVYFQMTRMIDLFEEYIAYKQYKYLRLDGSSKISDRRDMVQDWQTRPEIFIFLLSTRAGGLGINLTAADTVIFYDSDWNPTVDQQAMDRAHRLGQTKQVTVYRLITKGTIEERILQRAKQKDEIQKVVISGGEFRQVDFKPREIVSLLLDDEELDDKLQMQLKRKAEEEEQKKAARPAKRSRKQALQDQNSKESTPALSPSNVDRLFSAGEDTVNLEDESTKKAAASSSSKSTRIGRPRTNFSFTG